MDQERRSAGLAEHFFRHESGRLIAHLTARFGAERIELIEDAVQSALLAALTGWGTRGVPRNPSAWLTRVAHNRLIDHLRKTGREVEQACEELVSSEPGLPTPLSGEIPDEQLRMLFVCCDPALPEQAQLVLSLKLLCGFSTREIAARLFIQEDNVLRILSRGRGRLRLAWGELDAAWNDPPVNQLGTRLPQVLSVVYLLFNEGYSSQRENEVIRSELCDEAIRLGQLLARHPLGDQQEVWALLALMHFHRARLDARTDADGHLLLLEEQDRSRWDALEIHRGFSALIRAQQGERFSRYLGEAAILAEHCLAPTFEATRWREIVDLYTLLEQHLGPSPIYTLNRAIAVAECEGPEAGLALLTELSPPSWLARYYLWDATLGELMRRAGQYASAQRHLERAIRSAPTRAERRIFEHKLSLCLGAAASLS